MPAIRRGTIRKCASSFGRPCRVPDVSERFGREARRPSGIMQRLGRVRAGTDDVERPIASELSMMAATRQNAAGGRHSFGSATLQLAGGVWRVDVRYHTTRAAAHACAMGIVQQAELGRDFVAQNGDTGGCREAIHVASMASTRSALGARKDAHALLVAWMRALLVVRSSSVSR
jgi:hypothetical protein